MCQSWHIVVGLCSELLKRLSYLIHLVDQDMVKSFRIELGSFQLWFVYSILRPVRQLTMGESGYLIRTIRLIRRYLWYLHANWTNQEVNLIWFDLWFARFVFFLCDSYFTNHGQIRQISMNIRINIHLICSNRANVDSYICNIRPIHSANQWLIHLIRSIHSRGRFDSLNLICPINFDLLDSLCKFSRFAHA